MSMNGWANMAAEHCCSDTKEQGWLWYCDVHDSHGNADDEDEARAMGAAHARYWADDDWDGQCVIGVAQSNPDMTVLDDVGRLPVYRDKGLCTQCGQSAIVTYYPRSTLEPVPPGEDAYYWLVCDAPPCQQWWNDAL